MNAALILTHSPYLSLQQGIPWAFHGNPGVSTWVDRAQLSRVADQGPYRGDALSGWKSKGRGSAKRRPGEAYQRHVIPDYGVGMIFLNDVYMSYDGVDEIRWIGWQPG